MLFRKLPTLTREAKTCVRDYVSYLGTWATWVKFWVSNFVVAPKFVVNPKFSMVLKFYVIQNLHSVT